MVAKSVKWALASLVIFSPAAAFALGLGDIRLLSPLNAPLDAEIEVLGATPEEISSLKAQIASRDLFAQKGLDFPVSLTSVTLTAGRTPDGREIIRIRSKDAMTEPFLTMLVEVNSTRSHLVREYSMLFDPPVFAPGDQRNNEPVATAATGGGTREGAITRAPAPAPAAPAPRQPESASTAAAPDSPRATPSAAPVSDASGSDRTVRRGETLSGIASEVAAGDSANSRAWMLAIYQNNPAAFEGNMNAMRSGAVLRIPEGSAVAAISPSEAGAEIRRQWSTWRGSAGAGESGAAVSEPGRLRLVPPAESAGGTPTEVGAQNSQLQSRVRELEGQLQESKRLLDARNAELAQLQSRLAQAQKGGAATPPPAEAAPAPAVEPPAAAATPPAAAETPPVEEPATAEAAPPEAAAEPPTEQPAEAPTPKPVVATPAAEESGSILDTLKEYWWAAAALIALLLVMFGVKAFRSRRRNEFDDSLSRLAASGADSLSRDPSGDTQPLRPVSRDRENAFVVEESGTHERPRFGGDLGAPVPPRNVASADETISSETAINLDQGDPLAEADFHMAYGLYDQAADLVRIAISREPDRRDLKLKLLEVFFVWGNKEQFLQTARELAETRERAAPGEWEKIVIMGKQLAPEDSLFAGGGGGAGLGGVDLDLEGGQSRVDFDLLGEPMPQGGVDLDIGSALGEGESEGTQTVTDSNLALHDDGFTHDVGTATTRQMTQKIRDNSPTAAFAADLEAPTVEQPALAGRGGDNPTVRQKVEVALRQGGQQAEQTAELAIDDLGLDLTALDTMEQPMAATQESPTLVAGLDERSRRIMDEAERRGIPRDADATAISSTGAWNLSSEDLDPTMPPTNVRVQNGDGSETSRLQALKGQDLDFNFNEADAPTSAYTNGSGSGIDLDVGTATVPDTAFTSTQKLNSEDLALPDLEPVTMSEVGTKLDLARAYMDMGDPEGARNILEEVLTEGSVAQKQEAQRLLESLPG